MEYKNLTYFVWEIWGKWSKIRQSLWPPGFLTALSLGCTKGPAPHPAPATHLLPLGPELVHGDGAVGVTGADPDVVALDHLLHLVLDGHDALPLAVRLWQRGLELLVGGDQALARHERGNQSHLRAPHSLPASRLHVYKSLCNCTNLRRKTSSGCFAKDYFVHESQVPWNGTKGIGMTNWWL